MTRAFLSNSLLPYQHPYKYYSRNQRFLRQSLWNALLLRWFFFYLVLPVASSWTESYFNEDVDKTNNTMNLYIMLTFWLTEKSMNNHYWMFMDNSKAVPMEHVREKPLVRIHIHFSTFIGFMRLKKRFAESLIRLGITTLTSVNNTSNRNGSTSDKK